MSHISRALATVGRETPVVNHEGFPSFRRSDREQARNYLRTGTLSGTFYASLDEVAADTVATLRRLGEADPVALAQETVAAREDGFMRTLPLVACAVLSGLPNKELFRHTLGSVVKTPKDLKEFVEMCKTGAIPGRHSFGGCSVAPVRAWLETISEYHALKYGSAASKGVSLRDAIKLAHPRPADDVVRERLGWLSGHVRGADVRLNPRIAAFEALKRETDANRIVELIREGGLPYEVVTAAVRSPALEVWVELLKLAPTFNLLRSLATFGRHGVFTDRSNVDLAVRKLGHADALKKARIQPFQAYAAWKAYSASADADPALIAAIADMLDASVANLPLFTGRVALAPDVSGSMQSNYTSEKSHTSAAEVAGVFTAGLLRRCPNVRVLPFEHEVISLSLNPRDSVLTGAQKIASVGGGGTSLSAPVEMLLREQDKVDLFVGITDNEEWVGRGFVQVWREYRRTVSPEARAVLVTVVPTPYSAAPESEPGVHFVHGWSDAVLRFVSEVGGAVSPPQNPVEEADEE